MQVPTSNAVAEENQAKGSDSRRRAMQRVGRVVYSQWQSCTRRTANESETAAGKPPSGTGDRLPDEREEIMQANCIGREERSLSR